MICLGVAMLFMDAGLVAAPGEPEVDYGIGEIEMLEEQQRRVRQAEESADGRTVPDPGLVDRLHERASWREKLRTAAVIAAESGSSDRMLGSTFVPVDSRHRVAQAVMQLAHDGQVDKQGAPYFLHPEAVAEIAAARVGTGDRLLRHAVTTTALLHDVIEDTPMTLNDLRAVGVDRAPHGRATLDAIDLLTHHPEDTYESFIEKVATADGAAGEVARKVKTADIEHNMGRFTPEIEARLGPRYEAALVRLHEGADSDQDRASTHDTQRAS